MILKPISCNLKMELEGFNEIELTHNYDKEGRWEYLDYDNVLSIPTPYKDIPGQLYRIYDKSKNMSSITVKARHIFYDLIDKLLIDVRPTNCTGEKALKEILKDTPFKGYSNIKNINTAYYIRKNIIEAIGGNDENSFLKRWGGELFLNNFNVSINEKVGANNNVKISYGKNLLGIEEILNLESVVTRIVPVGYNGIMLEGDSPWIDSPLINNYSNIKMREIKFEDVKVKEKDDEEGFKTLKEAQEELKRRCNLEFSKNNIDKPKVNYKAEFLDLSKIEEYKDFKILETVLLGDTVQIKHERLNIDVDARVISFEYDCLSKKFISLELGNYSPSYAREKAYNSLSLEKINKSFNDEGNLKGSYIEGFINALKSPIIAQKDIAQKQDILAMICEDKDPNSKNFGAMCWGTKGFMIANKRTPDNRDWDWSTFGSGQGFSADFINAGILSAITIMNRDGSFEIDLSKSGGCLFKNNGKDAIKIANNEVKLFNWQKNGQYIGGLMSLISGDDANKPVIALGNETNSASSISYRNTKNGEFSYAPYIRFDKYKVLDSNNPITIFEDVDIKSILNFYTRKVKEGTIFSDNNNLILKGKDSLHLGTLDNNCILKVGGLTNGYDAYILGKFGVDKDLSVFGKLYIEKDISTKGNLHAEGNANIVGNLVVGGSKNRIVKTKNYGTISLNAYETSECYFGDIKRDKLKNKKCTVKIDNIFKETVNTKVQYEVKTWSYGEGIVYVDPLEMFEDYFIVRGNKDIPFGYEIIAKQKDYENDRLKEYL